jgi:hypothetical protein
MSKEDKVEIDPRAFGYRQGSMVEVPAEIFDILRGFIAEETAKRPPKKLFLSQKPVFDKKTGKSSWEEFSSDKEYKNQTTIETRDVESFNYTYVANLIHQAHMENIEKGNAVLIDTLREEAKAKQDAKLTKVED